MKALSLVFAVASLATLAHADSLRSSIEKGDKAVSKASLAKDMVALEKALRAYMAPGFVYSEGGKKQTVDEMISGMKMGIGGFKKVTVSESKIISLKEKGSTATAVMTRAMGGVMTGPDKKEHTMVYSGTTDETFVKLNGKWLSKSMTWRSSKVTMDGKPMGPSGAGK